MQDDPARPPDLVIFDNDGVLVDSEPIANDVLAGLLTAAGVPTTREESMARYVGSSLQRVRDLMLADHGLALAETFEDDYHRQLFDQFRASLPPMPGAADLLDALRAAGIPICVASSGSVDRIELALELTGLLDRFEGHIFSASAVEHGKPAPDLFLHAAAEMGADIARSVVIEDSAIGIQAGVASGARVYALAPDGPTPSTAPATGGSVRRLDELIPVLAPPR